MNWLIIGAVAWLIAIGLILYWLKGADKEDDPDWFWNH